MVRTLVKYLTRSGQSSRLFFEKHWPVSGIIDFWVPEDNNLRMFAKCDDTIVSQAYWNGFEGYEFDSARLFFYLAQRTSTIVDIGANSGYFSLVASAANPRATIVAFEPVPTIHERLKLNLSLNATSRVFPECKGVGTNDEALLFYVPDLGNEIPQTASLQEGRANKAKVITIDTVSLDEYRKREGLDTIGLMKIDAQLREPEVLEGMREILENDRPILMIEVVFPDGKKTIGHIGKPHSQRIEEALQEFNYTAYLITDNALIRQEKLAEQPNNNRYLFAPLRSEKERLPYSEMDLLVEALR